MIHREIKTYQHLGKAFIWLDDNTSFNKLLSTKNLEIIRTVKERYTVNHAKLLDNVVTFKATVPNRKLH